MFVSLNTFGSNTPVRNQENLNGSKSNVFKNNDENGLLSTKPYNHKTTLHVKTPDMIYSGANGAGLSFYLKYAEESTKENPIVKATGIDEKGNDFEQTISLNNIDPANATYVEMRALEAHNNVFHGIMSMTSLPLDCGKMVLNERANFFDMFEKGIQDFNNLGRFDLATVYEKCYQSYLEITDRNKDA